MTYIKWKDEVESYLNGIPDEERRKILSYFAEMYADKRDAGKSEAQIIEEFGAPYDVAKRILEGVNGNSSASPSQAASSAPAETNAETPYPYPPADGEKSIGNREDVRASRRSNGYSSGEQPHHGTGGYNQSGQQYQGGNNGYAQTTRQQSYGGGYSANGQQNANANGYAQNAQQQQGYNGNGYQQSPYLQKGRSDGGKAAINVLLTIGLVILSIFLIGGPIITIIEGFADFAAAIVASVADAASAQVVTIEIGLAFVRTGFAFALLAGFSALLKFLWKKLNQYKGDKL